MFAKLGLVMFGSMVAATVLTACGPSPAWLTVTAEIEIAPKRTATAIARESTTMAMEATRAVTATYLAENPPTPTRTPIPRSTVATADKPRTQPSTDGNANQGVLIPTVAGHIQADVLAQAGCRHMINVFLDVRDYRLTMPELHTKLREVDDNFRYSDTPGVSNWSRTLLRLHGSRDYESLGVALILVAGQCAKLLE